MHVWHLMTLSCFSILRLCLSCLAVVVTAWHRQPEFLALDEYQVQWRCCELFCGPNVLIWFLYILYWQTLTSFSFLVVDVCALWYLSMHATLENLWWRAHWYIFYIANALLTSLEILFCGSSRKCWRADLVWSICSGCILSQWYLWDDPKGWKFAQLSFFF